MISHSGWHIFFLRLLIDCYSNDNFVHALIETLHNVNLAVGVSFVRLQQCSEDLFPKTVCLCYRRHPPITAIRSLHREDFVLILVSVAYIAESLN